MKIYISKKLVTGPWGGGNKTAKLLFDKLAGEGHDVVFDIEDGIDIIFCMDPRPNDKGVWYQTLFDYREKNKNTKIIQRVGDIGTHGKPDLTKLVIQSLPLSDFVIFPSDWARRSLGYPGKNYTVIKNQAMDLFHKNKKQYAKDPGDTVNIVTHHWSTNEKKGFDYYSFLCNVFKENDFNVNFTFIGRKPENFLIGSGTYIPPQDDNYLSEVLPQFDIYLTASLHEAGANHVLEGIAAGLPVVYHDLGGSIPEYACDYGVAFSDTKSMIDAIKSVCKHYRFFKNKALSYNKTLQDSIEDYYEVICSVR